MRRSTAAAVGTLTGAALIIGVRLSVTPPAAPVAEAPPPVDAADTSTPSSDPTSGKSSSAGKAGGGSSKKKESSPSKTTEANKSGLKDGTYRGKGITDPYGVVQVTLKVSNGEISDLSATYPTGGESAQINPAAVPRLKQEALKSQSAKLAVVSGATYTSKAYAESLQSALDAAKA